MPALFTAEELALASPAESEAPEVAEAPAPKRKRPDGYGREMFDPSPEEIRRLCRESIQPGWTAREERERAGRREWTPPVVGVSAAAE